MATSKLQYLSLYFRIAREKFSDLASAIIFYGWNCQATAQETCLVAEYSNLNLRMACDLVKSLGIWERGQISVPYNKNLRRAFTVSVNRFCIPIKRIEEKVYS